MRRPQLVKRTVCWSPSVVVCRARPQRLGAGPPQERPTFRSGVDVIEVDVTVIDGDGRPIPDVEASEFTVSIDGDPRNVVQAQFIWLRPPQESLPPALESQPIFYTSNTDQRRGRLIVIAVDEESIHFGEGRHVMRAAGEFVDQLTPLDRVALMALPTGQYIDFTSDLDRVRRGGRRHGGSGPARAPRSQHGALRGIPDQRVPRYGHAGKGHRAGVRRAHRPRLQPARTGCSWRRGPSWRRSDFTP